jgi:hypothetical protein
MSVGETIWSSAMFTRSVISLKKVHWIGCSAERFNSSLLFPDRKTEFSQKNPDLLLQQTFSSTHFLVHSMATPSFCKDHKLHYWLCFALLGHHSYKHMRRKDLQSRCSRDLLRSKIFTSYVLTRMVKRRKGRSISSLPILHEQPPKISERRTVKRKP